MTRKGEALKIVKDETREKLKDFTKWGKRLFWIIPLLIVAAIALTSFYTVNENEQAVVTSFGKYTKTANAGLNFKLPWPVQSATILPVKRTQKIELGYRLNQDGSYDSILDESLMITGDMNVVSIDFFVEWKISDPVKYLYVSESPEAVLKNMLQSSVRSVVGTTNIDDALTSGKVQIQLDVKDMLTEKLAKNDIGIQILEVKVNDSEPPNENVAKAFRDVETAKQEKQTSINVAQEYRNRLIPNANSHSDKIIRSAEALKQSKINAATGEKNRFEAMYNEYINYPIVTRNRMYLEIIEKTLPGVNLFIDDGTGVDKLLPIGNWDNSTAAAAEAATTTDGGTN